MRQRLLLGLLGLAVTAGIALSPRAASARARPKDSLTLVARENRNITPINLAFATDLTSAPVHAKQMFLNNLDQIESVSVLLGNWGSQTSDFVTLKIGTACNGGTGWQLWGGAEVTLPPGLTSTWVTIPLPAPMDVTHGDYYILEVSTRHAQVATNRDGYPWGRRVLSHEAMIPDHYKPGLLQGFRDFAASTSAPGQRRQDLMFVVRGGARAATAERPTPTTNRACPSSCILVGATENAPGGNPANALNVMIRELEGLPDGSYGGGSFYDDDMATLTAAIRTNLLEGEARFSGVSGTYPFSDLYQREMNFYVAREAPSWDPEYLRGYMHCANIDVIIDINTGIYRGAHASPGAFQGVVGDPRVADARPAVLHEVFGHGFGLLDECACSGAGCALGSTGADHYLNSVPLGSGATACADESSASWCTSSLTVDQLITAMAADPDRACWTFGQAECVASADACHYIGDRGIAYFGAHTCVPKTVITYDIGVGCVPESGCFIGTAQSCYATSLDTAQPGVQVLQTSHTRPPRPGYGGAMEEQLSTLLDCVFDTTSCTGYDDGACSAFLDRWDGGSPQPHNAPFLVGAKACAGGVSQRR